VVLVTNTKRSSLELEDQPSETNLPFLIMANMQQLLIQKALVQSVILSELTFIIHPDTTPLTCGYVEA